MGSWAYPDGLAAILLGRWFKLPVVVKVHGSDLNVFSERDSVRRVLSRKLPRADRLLAVSRALAAKAHELGVAADRIAFTSQWGRFGPFFALAIRTRPDANWTCPTDACSSSWAGLKPARALLDLLQAFESIAPRSPDLRLALVGDGAKRPAGGRRSRVWPGRIFLPGAQPLAQVARWIRCL